MCSVTSILHLTTSLGLERLSCSYVFISGLGDILPSLFSVNYKKPMPPTVTLDETRHPSLFVNTYLYRKYTTSCLIGDGLFVPFINGYTEKRNGPYEKGAT